MANLPISQKPSPKFIKHGFLAPSERYIQGFHVVFGDTMEQRNVNYTTNPPSTFYTDEEMETMRNEITVATCPICLTDIDDDVTCRACKNGHKFHNMCYENQENPTVVCPICRETDIHRCHGNFNDITSGGKRRKTRIKGKTPSKTRTKKKSTKRRRQRKK